MLINKKKLIIIVVVIACITTTITACSGTQSSEDDIATESEHLILCNEVEEIALEISPDFEEVIDIELEHQLHDSEAGENALENVDVSISENAIDLEELVGQVERLQSSAIYISEAIVVPDDGEGSGDIVAWRPPESDNDLTRVIVTDATSFELMEIVGGDWINPVVHSASLEDVEMYDSLSVSGQWTSEGFLAENILISRFS